MSNTIVLSIMEEAELTQRATSQSGRADEARRARLILLLDSGHTWAAVRDKLDCTDSFIDRWSKRFLAERLAGLFSRHAGQLPTTGPTRSDGETIATNSAQPPASQCKKYFASIGALATVPCSG